MRKATYALLMSYQGEAFHGFARQGSLPTIEAALRQALADLGLKTTALCAAGRTDAGVHANAQVVSFKSLTKIDCAILIQSLNAQLAPKICIVDARQAHAKFHARASAVSRLYRYHIEHSLDDTYEQRRAWRLPYDLDAKAMQSAAASFVGKRDFAAFCWRAIKHSTQCEVYQLKVSQSPYGTDIDLAANRFLRRMVRGIVAVLVAVGRAETTAHEVEQFFDFRQKVVFAPARGLYLHKVCYPPELDPFVSKS